MVNEMPLSQSQIKSLMSLVHSVSDDSLDCDGCYDKIAEFAELQLGSLELPDAMKAVEVHLEQCVCCKDEYNALLDALREIESAN
jgi:hypothetical protein